MSSSHKSCLQIKLILYRVYSYEQILWSEISENRRLIKK